MSYPRFEKVDEHNIRVIVEAGDEISLKKLLENKEITEKKIKQLQDKLAYIDEVIAQAYKLGIVVEEVKDNTNENENK